MHITTSCGDAGQHASVLKFAGYRMALCPRVAALHKGSRRFEGVRGLGIIIWGLFWLMDRILAP